MKPGDLIRVAKQPPGLHAGIAGEVGYVEEIDSEGIRACIVTLNPNGLRGGSGWVPLDCLEPHETVELVQAKQRHDQALAAFEVRILARTEQFNKLIERLAQQHGITPDAVRDIGRAIDEFEHHPCG